MMFKNRNQTLESIACTPLVDCLLVCPGWFKNIVSVSLNRLALIHCLVITHSSIIKSSTAIRSDASSYIRMLRLFKLLTVR